MFMYKSILQFIFFIILLILKKIKYFFFRKWTKSESKGNKLKGNLQKCNLNVQKYPQKAKEKNHKQILKEVKYKKT